MSAAVSFCWDSGIGFLHEGEGTTVNVSTRGVFVRTEFIPRIGVQLELYIYMSLPGPDARKIHFHGEGKVVRTTQKSSESGFAAEVLFQTGSSNSGPGKYNVVK